MGKIDISLSSYLSHPPVFADLFNAWLYGGRQVIDYHGLRQEDPVQNRPEYSAAYKHVRDVVKMYYQDGMELVLLGIENQEKIDYTAPVRIMQDDGADYQKKVRRVEEENRKRLGLKTGFPAFFPDDRITPVITLLLYFGEEEWKRPRRLHDLLRFPEESDRLRSFVPDYPIHVLSVRRDMDISLLHTELRQVFGFLQCQEDRKALKKYVKENEHVFSRLSKDAALFLAAAAKGTQILSALNVKEESCNMCKALDDLYNDGVNQGKSQGLELGEEYFAALSQKLLADFRIDDLQKAIKNKEYRKKLYQEYRIERC